MKGSCSRLTAAITGIAAVAATGLTAIVPAGAQAAPRFLATGQPVDALVVLNSQADVSQIQGETRATRLANLERRLRNHATRTQADLLTYLKAQQDQQTVSAIEPLWITNEIHVEATAAVLQEIALRPDVLAVRSNSTFAAPSPAALTGPDSGSVEPNASAIHAPDLWSLGFRGQHTVVANMDTGVDSTHPDLAGSWRGGTNSWYDPNGEHPTTPTDVNGHGTQTMGVIVGGDGGGSSIGVAPDAKWIAVKIFDDHGTASSLAIHQGFQWLLDPDGDPATPDAPKVVNNSWGGARACSLEFQPDLASLRAAGIVPVFSAGNDGPAPGTVSSPGNLPEALAVGGTDNNGNLDAESSRGPSACSGAIAPGLVAPGVGIRTTDLYAGYISDTGTSVAAPHVAGVLALLLSAFPGLSADRQQAAVEAAAADLGSAGVDNDFGFGMVDALAAYQWLASEPDFTVSVSPSAVSVTAGSTTTFVATVTAANGFVSDVGLSLEGLSASEASWTFSPDTIAGGGGTSQLQVTTSSSLPTGVYPITISATDGSLVRSAQTTLTVIPPPDFSIATTPMSATVAPGASASYAVTVTAANGFDGNVALLLSGLPGSVGTASFVPALVAAGGTAELTVSTLGTAPRGTYMLTVTGTSGAVVHSTSITLVIARDFTLSVSPSAVTVKRGRTASYSVSVSALGGFTGKVSLSVTGTPPGTVGHFGRLTLAVPGTTTLKIRTYSSTRRGTYAITVRGSSGSLSHQVVVSLTVT